MKKTKQVIKPIVSKLRKWNQVFCRRMICKTNLNRDLIIISVVVLVSGAFILADRYLNNKRIQAKETAILQDMKIFSELPEQVTLEEILDQVSDQVDEELPVQEVEKTFDQESQQVQADPQNNENVSEPVDIKKSVPKVVVPRAVETKSTGQSCIKIPANILSKLKNAPVPPDGKKKDGKLVCHVLAEGEKDHPHNSDKNPKGEWGGCCYDPDEVPNPNCCYPVGSVYEKYLKKYFEKPFFRKK